VPIGWRQRALGGVPNRAQQDLITIDPEPYRPNILDGLCSMIDDVCEGGGSFCPILLIR
jgi:hypothetical protein